MNKNQIPVTEVSTLIERASLQQALSCNAICLLAHDQRARLHIEKCFLAADLAARIYVVCTATCRIFVDDIGESPCSRRDRWSQIPVSTIILPITVGCPKSWLAGNISLNRERSTYSSPVWLIMSSLSLLSIILPGSHLLIGFLLCNSCRPIQLVPREWDRSVEAPMAKPRPWHNYR